MYSIVYIGILWKVLNIAETLIKSNVFDRDNDLKNSSFTTTLSPKG